MGAERVELVADASFPAQLAKLHRVLAVGESISAVVTIDETASDRPAWFDRTGVADGFEGAGLDIRTARSAPGRVAALLVTATRARTLADTVGEGMLMLACGLNPSLYSADAGRAFARPGNRFWPALRLAGLTGVGRDPDQLLVTGGIGLTDLVKRASVGAGELHRDEYRHGLARVERLCRRLRPAAVCFVGLAGWRAAVDRQAVAGWQEHRLGGTPVYVMPSTSGLNAHSSLRQLADHLATAAGK